jgi:aminoglycoside phosphotransferase (APT) family kinase protein
VLLDLPEFPAISDEAIHSIIQQHHLSVNTFRQLPEVGIFNAIYQLGDTFILRVPRNHPAFMAAAHKESIAVPAARLAGVRTPQLIVFDDSLKILPVPYSIYERVEGRTLGLLDLDPTATPSVWNELGRDLAQLHQGVKEDPLTSQVGMPEDLPDPYVWVEEMATDGHFTRVEANWFTNWLDRLKPATQSAIPKRFLHGDTQTTNLIIKNEGLEYVAVLDWGASCWGDPAWDFAGVPLRAVPFILEGYRSLSPIDQHESAEARILLRHLHLSLFLLRREPQPQRSWAERPTAMFIETMRFFLEQSDVRWMKLLP